MHMKRGFAIDMIADWSGNSTRESYPAYIRGVIFGFKDQCVALSLEVFSTQLE